MTNISRCQCRASRRCDAGDLGVAQVYRSTCALLASLATQRVRVASCPTTFDLAVNTTTAKAIQLKIPRGFMLRVNGVIE